MQKAIDAARETGLRRFIHLSTLSASAAHGSSYYLRSKGEAEVLLRGAPHLQVTIIRPSLVFGPGDGFFMLFARMLRYLPVLPLARPEARFAPVYLRDVAQAVVQVLPYPDTRNYALCGPRQYTMIELVRYVAKCLGLRRIIVPLPDTLALMQAMVCEYIPGKPFSLNTYYSLMHDNVCSRPGGDLTQYGIEPTALEAIMPDLLRRTAPRPRYGDHDTT